MSESNSDFFTIEVDLQQTLSIRKELAITNISYLNAMKDISGDYANSLAEWQEYMKSLLALESGGDISSLLSISIPELKDQ